MDGPNTNQISNEKVNHHKWFKLRVHFLSHCKQSSLSRRLQFQVKTWGIPLCFPSASHISKLEAFFLICHFFPQHDPHKITHLQTRGILPSLSAKQSFLNMIHTRSHISKLGAFSLVCQLVRISSQKHVSIITPNNIDLQSHPNFSKISLLFHHFVDSGKISITSSLQLPSKDSALQAPREMQICL
jgi:hypothetical protein